MKPYCYIYTIIMVSLDVSIEHRVFLILKQGIQNLHHNNNKNHLKLIIE